METKYFVNEEKHTVVCKITGIVEAVAKDLDKKNICAPPWVFNELPDECIGKSVCSPEDVEAGLYSEEKGRIIAYKRAADKAKSIQFRFMNRIMRDCQEDHEKVMKGMEVLADKYKNVRDNIRSSLDAVVHE